MFACMAVMWCGVRGDSSGEHLHTTCMLVVLRTVVMVECRQQWVWLCITNAYSWLMLVAPCCMHILKSLILRGPRCMPCAHESKGGLPFLRMSCDSRGSLNLIQECTWCSLSAACMVHRPVKVRTCVVMHMAVMGFVAWVMIS